MLAKPPGPKPRIRETADLLECSTKLASRLQPCLLSGEAGVSPLTSLNTQVQEIGVACPGCEGCPLTGNPKRSHTFWGSAILTQTQMGVLFSGYPFWWLV